jgi:hypothetical protein
MPRDITVTFEDGTNHVYKGAPDDITPDAVQARAQKEFNKPIVNLDGGAPTIRQNVGAEQQRRFYAGSEVPVAALVNAPGSALQMLGGYYEAITSPAETLKTVSQAIGGGFYNALPKEAQKFVVNVTENPEGLKKAIDTANTIGGIYTDRYGDWEKIKRTMAEDPFGAMSDLSMLFTGGGAAVSKAGKVAQATSAARPVTKAGEILQTVGDVTQTAGKYTNPLAPIGPTVSFAGKYLNVPIQGATNLIAPFFAKGQEGIKLRGYAEALGNDPAKLDAAIKLLQAGNTIEQTAVALNSSGLASFARTAQDASTVVRDLYNARDAVLKANQTNQLAGATQNLNALAQSNIPVSPVSPNAPRNVVNQALSAEAQALQSQKLARTSQLTAEQQAAADALAAQQASVAGRLPNVSQLETGKTLADANAAILENTKQTVTQPAYNAAFKASPKATIDVSNLATAAKGQLNDLLTQLKGMAPNAAALLEEYGPKTQVINMGDGATTTIPVKAKPITLEEAHKIRQAINIDRAALKGSIDSAANTARLRLGQLYDEVNTSIKAGTSPEAFKLFKEANDLFKERIVDVYRTGQPANLSRQSTLNQPMLLPENIVSTVLKSEGNAKDFLKVYSQDPAALQTLKTGVEDLYRQEVLKPGAGVNAHATFMFNNEKQLAALDQAGMGIRSRLNTVGDELGKVKVGEEALKEAKKSLPNVIKTEFAAQDEALKLLSSTLKFRNADELRAAVVKDPMAMDMALRRLDAPAKASLARGVMQDAMSGIISGEAGSGASALKHLTQNEANIMKALKAADPKTATKTFADAKEMADLYRLVEETGNKLNVAPGTVNALTTAKNLDKLTQGLPEVRAVVDQLQKQIKQGVDFKTLAEQGRVAGGGSIELLTNAMPANPSGFFGKEWTIANYLIRRLKGSVDNKLAVEIANELLTSESAAAMLSKAQAKQTGVMAKIKKGTKATAETTLNALSSRGALGATQLTRQPEEQNQNALAR